MSYADSITNLANVTLTVTRRQEVAPTVYTTTRLYIGSTEAGTEGGYLPDLITIGDKQHEVEHLEHWSAFGAQHYKAICRAKVS